MVITTREQRVSLNRVFNRAPLYFTGNGQTANYNNDPSLKERGIPPLSYREFRHELQPTFGCDGAVAIQWLGMWLCIEKDGYCHS